MITDPPTPIEPPIPEVPPFTTSVYFELVKIPNPSAGGEYDIFNCASQQKVVPELMQIHVKRGVFLPEVKTLKATIASTGPAPVPPGTKP